MMHVGCSCNAIPRLFPGVRLCPRRMRTQVVSSFQGRLVSCQRCASNGTKYEYSRVTEAGTQRPRERIAERRKLRRLGHIVYTLIRPGGMRRSRGGGDGGRESGGRLWRQQLDAHEQANVVHERIRTSWDRGRTRVRVAGPRCAPPPAIKTYGTSPNPSNGFLRGTYLYCVRAYLTSVVSLTQNALSA